VPYRVRVKLARRRNEDEEATEKVRRGGRKGGTDGGREGGRDGCMGSWKNGASSRRKRKGIKRRESWRA
jgi:hypothetical protein